MDIPEYLEKRHGIALSAQQREAVAAPDGRILLRAVPGAGKTTVLIARLAELICNRGADPSRILIITYSREAAADMRKKWETLFGEVANTPPRFSTIHSFCLHLLKLYAQGRGTALPTLIGGAERDGVQQNRILTALWREQTGEYPDEDRLCELSNALGYIVNMRLNPEELEKTLPGIAGLYRAYRRYKTENRLMDFDDMLLYAYTALSRSETLRGRVRGQYDYLCLDEAQDTSKIQHEILRMVAGENLFAVGDEDQSIYGFRGAYPQGLTDFFAFYGEGSILKLERNFRSTGAIVEAARVVIEGAAGHIPKEMYTERPFGARAELVYGEDFDACDRETAERLAVLPEGETCAVLYRSAVTGVAVGRLLEREGIPFTARRPRGSFASDFICRDILNIMAFAEDPADKRFFARCYFRLNCAIPRAAAVQAREEAQGDVLLWIADHCSFSVKNTGRLEWASRVLRQMRRQSPARQLHTILYELGYLDSVERGGQTGYAAASQLRRLGLLCDLAAQAKNRLQLAELVAGIFAAQERAESSRIFLSTVHSAKGREFDHVILADAAEGIFPDSGAAEAAAMRDTEALEEERRLFYTAVTRAKESLTILIPAGAFDRSIRESRFVTRLRVKYGEESAEAAIPGTKILHTSFGMGTVLWTDSAKNRVGVDFMYGGEKTLTLEAFCDPGIVQII